MRKILFALSLLSTILLVSCEKNTTPSLTPAQPGQITMDRSKVGVGQPVTLTCPVDLGQNVKSYEVYWKFPSGLSELTQLVGGKAILKDYKPNSVGSYEIACIVKSIGDEGAEQKESKITFTTVACDYHNSFWGDNLAETQRNVPTLKLLEGRYYASYEDNLHNIITAFYTFESDKLASGTDILIHNSLALLRSRVLASVIENATSSSFEAAWVDASGKTPEAEEAIRKISDDMSFKVIKYTDYQVLESVITNGQLILEFSYQNASNQSVLVVKKQNGGNGIAYNTTYNK